MRSALNERLQQSPTIAFTPGREQDASATIRGFKYQIQLTLQRWLDLPASDVLYLECGEDVDRVLQVASATDVQRVLEQIKARQQNITLRTADVLAALANFAAHLKANPSLSLRFRFTTTASPGREKLSPLDRGTKAIEVWKSLHDKELWTADDVQTCSRLAQLLAGASRPDDCPPEAWASLQDIVAGAGRVPFTQFVRQFEWSCGSVTPEDIRPILLNRLGQLPGDTGPDDPSREQRYNQLVAALLDILSRPGEKKLTSELLATALAAPTLTEYDRARLRLMEERSASQAAIIGSLQQAIQGIEAASSRLMLFGPAAATLQSVQVSTALPSAPPLVKKLARRTKTVDELTGRLTPAHWLAIHGEFGTGKSHLGFLVAERQGGILLGVSMRDLPPTSAAQGLVTLISNPQTRLMLQSPAPGVVVLDDLPDVAHQSGLAMALATLAQVVLSTRRSLISTSRRALPQDLADRVGNAIISQPVPAFCDTDATELFRAFGFDEDMLAEQRVSGMNAMCCGHPMLLTALARHLLAHRNKPGKGLAEALLKSTHREQLDLATCRAVLETIEAEACRKLLYRLASAGAPMSLPEIRLVAAVEPALAEPTQCVARLDGLWLRQAANARYEVSPLVAPLWRDVPANVNKSLHRQVARLIFDRARLNVSEFTRANCSLLISDQQEVAAMHLLHGCMSFPHRAAGYSSLGILLFFPPDGSHGLRPITELPLRAAQAVTAAIEKSDIQPYLARIEAATEHPTIETAMGTMLAGGMILMTSLSIPIRLGILGASLVERARGFPNLSESVPSFGPAGTDIGHLILPSACVHTWDDLDAFIDFVGTLPSERRQKLLATPEMRECMPVVTFRPLFDSQKGITQGAFDRLVHAEDRCAALGLTVFGAYAASAKLVILGEYRKDSAAMLAEGERAKGRFAADPMAVAVIHATIGQQLYLAKRPSEATEFLRQALDDPTHIIGFERGTRLVDAISAAWEANEDGGAFGDQLATLLEHDDIATPDLRCQMQAQIALVRWRQRRRSDAFAYLERAVTQFFTLEDNVRKRQLGAGLAHTIHYYEMIAETGRPPSQAADGGVYAEPMPRMFSGMNERMAKMWQGRQGPAIVQWMLGRLADSVGLADAATVWTDRALEAALQSSSAPLISLLAPRGVAAAVQRAAWPDAIEAAITHARARLFVENRRRAGSNALEDSLTFDPFEPPGGDERQRAEEWTIWVLARMLALYLGPRAALEDGHLPSALTALADELARLREESMLKPSWQAMTDVVRMAAAPQMTDEQHHDLLAVSAKAGVYDVRLLAHGLLAFRSDISFAQAAASQLGAFFDLVSTAKACNVSVDGYGEAITRFWVRAISDASFRFSSPRELRRTIAELPSRPRVLGAKLMLRAVVNSLSLSTIDANVLEWLNAS